MSCFCRPTNKAAFCSKAHSKRSLPARKRSIYTIHTIVHHHSATQVATERSSGHFEGERVGTALPLIVKVFKNALWTAFRTIFRPEMHSYYRISHIHAQSQNFSAGDTPWNSQRRSRWCLDPDINFCLAR